MTTDDVPTTPETPATPRAQGRAAREAHGGADEAGTRADVLAMPHRLIAHAMRRDVVSVRRDTSLKRVAQRLAEHRISGVPVVDSEDRVLGVVSLSDLAAWQAARANRADPIWARLLRRLRTVRRPLSHHRAGAQTAGGLMSAPAIVLEPRQNVVEAARIMARRRVDRLPVIDEECRLVGIVTRTDLLSLFLRPDGAIRDEIEREVLTGALLLPERVVTATVYDGVVTLSGTVPRRSDIPIALRLTSRVDGVVATVDGLDFDKDDTYYLPADYYARGGAEDWLRRY